VYTLPFWKLCVSSFLFFISFNILIPELPDYLTSLGGEDYKGYIIGVFTIVAGLSRPISGKLTDSIGRIPVMVFGGVVCVITSFFYPLVSMVFPFLALRAVHGMSTGFNPTGVIAYAADIIPAERRGEAMGVLGVLNNIGSTLGFGLSSTITNYIGITNLFYLSGCCALLSVGIILTLKESSTTKKSWKNIKPKISLADIYDNRAFVPAVVMFLSTISFGSIITLVPDYATYLNISNKGIYLMVMTLSSILVRISSGKISDRIGRLKTTIIGSSFWILSMSLLIFPSQYTFYSSAFLAGMATGFNSPTLFAWAVDVAKGIKSGMSIATLFIALEFGISIGAFSSAAIYQNNNSYLPITFLMLVVINIGTLLFLLIQNKAQHTVNK
jgi:MFS family permease